MPRGTVGMLRVKLSGVMATMTGGSVSFGPPVGVIIVAQRLRSIEPASSRMPKLTARSACRLLAFIVCGF